TRPLSRVALVTDIKIEISVRVPRFKVKHCLFLPFEEVTHPDYGCALHVAEKLDLKRMSRVSRVDISHIFVQHPLIFSHIAPRSLPPSDRRRHKYHYSLRVIDDLD